MVLIRKSSADDLSRTNDLLGTSTLKATMRKYSSGHHLMSSQTTSEMVALPGKLFSEKKGGGGGVKRDIFHISPHF